MECTAHIPFCAEVLTTELFLEWSRPVVQRLDSIDIVHVQYNCKMRFRTVFIIMRLNVSCLW